MVPRGGALLVVVVVPPPWSTGPLLARLGEMVGSGSVVDWFTRPVGPPGAFTGGTVALQ